MKPFPKLATGGRVFDAVLIVSCGVLQAVGLAIAAFATRDAFAALHSDTGLGAETILKLGFAGIFIAVFFCVSRRRAERLGQSYAIDLRHLIYEKIAQLPKSRHDQRRVGALSLRFVGDLSAARLWFGRGLPDILTAIVVLPGAVSILFLLGPSLAITALGPLMLSLIVMSAIAWRLERRHRRLRERRASIAINMIERIAVAPELDLMGRTRKELRALDDQGQSLLTDAVARTGRTAALQAIVQAGAALSGVAVLWVANREGIAPATVAASLSVLALVTVPLKDVAAAWDRYCAWCVARDKASKLLDEPRISRRSRKTAGPVAIDVTGKLNGTKLNFTAPAGQVTTLTDPLAQTIAWHICGLDQKRSLRVKFDGQPKRPKLAYIGDTHVGLQGSLRRSVTMMSRKRPEDAHIKRVLKALGLEAIASAQGGLDQRMSENGKGLTPEQTLRIDVARAVLGDVNIIVIASMRWAVEPHKVRLLSVVKKHTDASVIVAQMSDDGGLKERLEVT